MVKQKIGILGGSFDPIHLTHTSLALSAYQQSSLDSIYFIPAYQAPLKNQTITSPESRLAMLKIALANFEAPYEIILDEIEAKTTSYSYHTAKKLTQKYPNSEFYWIIGSDHLKNLHKWYNIDELAKIVKFICAKRCDYDMDLSPLPKDIKLDVIDFNPTNFSSTQIRESIKNKKAPTLMLDKSVYKYIVQHKLYI